MATDDKEIVTALRAQLAQRIGRQRFELWFGDQTRLALHETTLTVESASEFFQDWLRKHFRRDIETVCAELLGGKVCVKFRVNTALAQLKPTQSTTARPAQDSLALAFQML